MDKEDVVCVCVYIYMEIKFGAQISNIRWIIEKARKSQKNIYFCFIDYAKAFACVDHNKLWKILQEMGIPDHLTSVQFSSVAQSCPTLCNPLNCSTPGLPVHH